MIPTIGSTQHYELNPTEYMRAVDNGVIGFANGIISLTNSALGSAWYIYQKGLPTVGKEMVEYLQGIGSDALAFAKNEWDYFLNTPIDKQLTGALNNVFGPKAAETYTTVLTGAVIGNVLNNASVGLNTAKSTAAATGYVDDVLSAGGKHTVYGLSDPATDEIKYIGRTTNPVARRYQHTISADKGGLNFVEIQEGLTYEQARGLEQLYFEQYGGCDKLLNKINPISPKNPNLPVYLQAAKEVR